MTREAVRDIVMEELCQLAPELDRAQLTESVRIRDELDLDSFDFVRLVARLSERLALPIPELDYEKLQTLGGCTDYLWQQQAAAKGP